MSDKLKEAISSILQSALNGTGKQYRMDGYIRWGLVEKDIHAAIDAALAESVAEPVKAREIRMHCPCDERGNNSCMEKGCSQYQEEGDAPCKYKVPVLEDRQRYIEQMQAAEQDERIDAQMARAKQRKEDGE